MASKKEDLQENPISESVKNILENSINNLERLSSGEDLSINDVTRIVQATDTLRERHNIEERGYDKQLPPRIEPEESDEVHVVLVRLRNGSLYAGI